MSVRHTFQLESQRRSWCEGRPFLRWVLHFGQLLLAALIVGALSFFGREWLIARSQTTDIFPQDTVVVPGTLQDISKASPGTLSSEHYRVGALSVGSDIALRTRDEEFFPLSVDDIRAETLGNTSRNEGRVLITWQTNKAANSTVRFGKSLGAENTVEETGFGMTHSAVLSRLDLASTYLYTITVRDRYGREVTSEAYAVSTGRKNVSLFELIVGALQEVFGWAIKK